MIYIYNKDQNLQELTLEQASNFTANNCLWVDLINPTPDEDRVIEKLLGISIPTREEMAEIELSNRLYEEDGAYYMTINLPVNTNTDEPESQTVTLILTKNNVITIRYSLPTSFEIFKNKLAKQKVSDSPAKLLILLMETITGRIADVLEKVSGDIEHVSQKIFREYNSKKNAQVNHEYILGRIGISENLITKIIESLVSIERMTKFLLRNKFLDEATLIELKSIIADIEALGGFCRNMENKLNFMLDATLGMISIEQNKIIKIMSVAAMVFLPPTLIASIYGMNFKFMPELEMKQGYIMALGFMCVSMLLPYLWFKRKKWL
jgi:magnesium transporter